MIRNLVPRRGTALRAVCAAALLAGLVSPATAFAADDNTFTLAPALDVPEQAGTLDASADPIDRYRVDLVENDVLTLDLNGVPATADFDIALYSPEVVVGPLSEEAYVLVRSNAAATPVEHIDFLVPPGGSGTYYVEVSAFAPGATGSYTIKAALAPSAGDAVRISGSDRYATSYAVSRSNFTTSSAVIIASGANFPDALSSAGLAGVLDCPVLLAPPAMSADDPRIGPLQREVERLGATDAYVIGGSAAVSDVLYGQIESWVVTAERVSGATRYETAKKVAERIDQLKGGGADDGSVFLVRGDSFPDALAVSPFAYAQQLPILLTKPTTLDLDTREYLDAANVGMVYIAGGTSAVSTNVESAVDALNAGATDTHRENGTTRYETASNVAGYFVDSMHWAPAHWSEVGIATGANFPDALSGGAAMGRRGGPLLLTQSTTLSAPTEAKIVANAAPGMRLLVFGGAVAVNDSVVNSIRGLLP